jgi:serine/threonine-protein kinase
MPEGDVGHYRLLRKLGQGAMAEVYLAQDLQAGRNVALKLLNPALTENEDLVRRFQQEARWAALVRHPNILTVYEVGEAGGRHYLAAEYVEGETLRQKMSRSLLPLVEVADISISIAEALEAAHREWIVHRDIKPENVILRSDGMVKVLDFGLAKLISPRGGRRNTEPGTIVGTLQYVAPEQALGLGVDPRADIFSLGVVLYEMVAGEPPFRAEALRHLLKEILEFDPPPPRRQGVIIPPRLTEMVNRALRKDPDDRHQSAREFAIGLRDLRPALAEAEGSADR